MFEEKKDNMGSGENMKENMGSGENMKENMGTADPDLRVKLQPKQRWIWKSFKMWGPSSLEKMACRVRRSMLMCCKNDSPLDMDKGVVVPLPSRSCRREEENLRRLMKTSEIKLQVQINVQKSMEPQETAMAKSIVAPSIPKPSLLAIRSSSVGASFGTSIAPIDEESPCYFPGSFKKRWSTPLPRGSSSDFSTSS